MAAACLAAAALATPARAADVVVTAGGAERRVSAAALRGSADVPAGTVVLRSEPGPGEVIAHPAAVSLPRVLELAGVAPAALSFVAVTRPNGTPATIRAGDLAAAPPLLWLDADSVRFFRPPRDDDDLNAADNFATAGEDLAVRVRQGALLGVQVRVRPERPRAGERVRLEAQVTGAPAGSAIAVRWRFGDGREAAGAAAAHRWEAPGTYAVVASAEGDGDSAGASAPVLVEVGERRARERGRERGRGGADPGQAPATGPDEGGTDPPSPAGGDPSSTAAPSAPAGPGTTSGGAGDVPPAAGDPPPDAGPRTRRPPAARASAIGPAAPSAPPSRACSSPPRFPPGHRRRPRPPPAPGATPSAAT